MLESFAESLVSNILSKFDIARRHNFSTKGYLKSLFTSGGNKIVMANMEYRDTKGLSIPQINGYSNCGVVFQGPIAKKENLTLETILLLRKIYPEIKIVLSTWEGELTESEKEFITGNNCYYLENSSCPSEDKGKGRKVGHLNNQLKSSVEGIRFLKDKGVEYVLKIRTDLRIYKYDFIPYFLNLLNVFKPNTGVLCKRLLCVGFTNNLIYCPFHMSDFIWFGNIEDMEKLYSISSRTDEELQLIRDKSDDWFFKQNKYFIELLNKPYDGVCSLPPSVNDLDFEFYFLYHEEAYIPYKFLLDAGLISKFEKDYLKLYWKFLKDACVVVDESELNIYWGKYGYSLLKYSSLTNNTQLTKSIWLDIMLQTDEI